MATVLPRAVALPQPQASARKGSARLWWHVHQWAGLKLSIFLAFILFTGTLAVVAHEIDWLLAPSLRVAPSSVTGQPDWARIAGAAIDHPSVKEVRSIAAPTASAFAARVTVKRADGSLGYLHAHPSTGMIQGETGFVDAHRILRNLHRHLNLPTWIGVPIVSALAFLMAVSLVTSLVVYKKWWRGFLKPVRWRDARTAWGDVHRLAGLWSLWFLALIAATGVWYFAESLGGDAPPMPKVEARGEAPKGPALPGSLALALTAAKAAAPDLIVESIRFPDKKNGAFVIEGQRSAWLVRPRANAVWADAASGRPLLATDARDLSVHQRISEMADPLHFGTFAGYWTKAPWFLFGLLLTALAVSGVAIHALRIGRAAKAGVVAIAWGAMGWWRWVAVAGVVTGFLMLPMLFVGGGE
jgi:uncharacterized iron-regulated membrane protein